MGEHDAETSDSIPKMCIRDRLDLDLGPVADLEAHALGLWNRDLLLGLAHQAHHGLDHGKAGVASGDLHHLGGGLDGRDALHDPQVRPGIPLHANGKVSLGIRDHYLLEEGEEEGIHLLADGCLLYTSRCV